MINYLIIILFQILTFNQKQYCVKTNSGFKCDFVQKQKTEFFVSENLLEEYIDSKYNEKLYLKDMTETVWEGDSVYSFTATSQPLGDSDQEYFIINISKSKQKLQIFRYYFNIEERWTFTNTVEDCINK